MTQRSFKMKADGREKRTSLDCSANRRPSASRGQRGAYHADGLAGSHVVIVGVPPLELWVLSVLQDVLLALEVGVVEADPGSALHADGVHPATRAHAIVTTATLPPGG